MFLFRVPEAILLVVVIVGLAVLLGIVPGRADCFEGLGCSNTAYFSKAEARKLSCENLWYTRNRIYDENGYCFGTGRAKAQFDNSDCYFSDQAAVPLNAFERANIDTLKGVEAAKGCK